MVIINNYISVIYYLARFVKCKIAEDTDFYITGRLKVNRRIVYFSNDQASFSFSGTLWKHQILIVHVQETF